MGAGERGAKRIRVHVLTDGRDIASGGGRMYVTMDRYENDWNVVKRGWDAQVIGEALHKFTSAVEAVKKLRENANDQYLPPFVIVDENNKAVGPIVDGDAVVTVNFRADRMVMLAKAFEYQDFNKFDHVRETVKFGHVTFFWNGNRSGCFKPEMEEYVEIPSDVGITFNVQPKMKALEIGEKARDAILSGKFDQVRVNIPNGDMVVIPEISKLRLWHARLLMMLGINPGNLLRTWMATCKYSPPTLVNPVPIAIGGPGLKAGVRFRNDVPNGELANVAATVMNLHGYVAPCDYEPSLIEVVGN
ncbi:2,3-bisphosphoglycerate-independent phosphoglycerate mutase [Hibiscus syriacus]|uniref:phosphoglycerate mutase (2,3-diphosphoglycerate-independent) n=1 Tax=Hibiscus syriacus TaxID=106335 RepID=A0A6A3AEF9_HIBSY|nr:2,3-bisphosphoglycerate-independent phosphoglycerate mutase [Hibiscus syriacus]